MTPAGRPAPPRLARLLVDLGAPSDDRALLAADLAERFDALAAERGARAAARWYWSQALRGLAARARPDLGLVELRSWRGTMGDVRQSARALARRPLYTLGVAGTLALGLASATAVTSVAWHVWLAPMPFPDPDRVVRLLELEPAAETGAGPAVRTAWRVSPPLLEDLRAHEWSTIDAVAGVSQEMFDWTREGGTSRASALAVSPELFGILGMEPIAGATLSGDRDAREVVLTEPFWRRAFGADPRAVGTTMQLGAERYVVVGVVALPSGYPGAADLVAPLVFDEEQLAEGMRGARYLDAVARVAPGHGVADAGAELDRFVADLGESHPNHAGWGGRAVVLSDELLRPYRSVLGLLLAAGVVFLLLAVVNVAGLVAARTAERRQERAVRLALGASEASLLRGGAVESVVLSAIAAAGALAVAYALLGPLAALVPPEVPRIDDVRLSVGIASVMLAVAAVAGLGVGVLAYLLSRGAGPSVGRSARATAPGPGGRGALVAGQVALTTLLATAGAGILSHMASLQGVDIGFRPRGVSASQVILSQERYGTTEERRLYWRSLLETATARGLDVALATNPPMAGMNMPWGFRTDPTAEQAFAQYHIVSPGYFRVMGIDLVAGRAFTPADDESAEPVVIVGEALGADVGGEIRVLNRPKRVVGVVRSTRHFGPAEDAPLEIYVPLPQDPWGNAHALVRGDAGAALALAAVLDALDPALDVPPPAPYTAYVDGWFAALRLQLVIVVVLAAVGTLLATLGLYALVAYRVNTRRREIGVRIALGASETRVLSDVVREGVRLGVVGMLVGFAAWYASLPAAGALLGDVEARDPRVPLAVALLVAVVAVGASVVPARRGVRVDPAVTLRSE